MDKTIQIKNNISPKLIQRHLKRIADDEEAERAKRAAEYNARCQQTQGQYVSTYIYFYEWSTLNGTMKTFFDYRSFFKFCVESNINLTETDRQILYNSNYNYVSCKKGKNDLIISKTYCGLKERLESTENNTTLCLLPTRVLHQPPMQYG